MGIRIRPRGKWMFAFHRHPPPCAEDDEDGSSIRAVGIKRFRVPPTRTAILQTILSSSVFILFQKNAFLTRHGAEACFLTAPGAFARHAIAMHSANISAHAFIVGLGPGGKGRGTVPAVPLAERRIFLKGDEDR